MTISEELARLHELHRTGALSAAEFDAAKARVIGGAGLQVGGAPGGAAAPLASLGALRRSRGDRWVAGVCGGLAHSSGADAWIWRLGFTLFSAFGGAGVLLYLLLWVFVPEE